MQKNNETLIACITRVLDPNHDITPATAKLYVMKGGEPPETLWCTGSVDAYTVGQFVTVRKSPGMGGSVKFVTPSDPKQ